MIYGCLPYKKDLRDYKVISNNVEIEYPEEFKLNNLPDVKNQNNIGSCCAHVISSIIEYYNINNHKMSTNFIYGIKKKLYNHNGIGMSISDACKIVTLCGDAIEKDCPGNDEVPDCYELAEDTYSDNIKMFRAYQFRTNSYYLCQSNNDIKYALMKFGPVIASVYWSEKYAMNPDNVIFFDPRSDSGLHAVMIYGWNKIGWLIQNSFGDEWGEQGKFILPFGHGFEEARVLIEHKQEDVALVRPKNNNLLNLIYKICNFIINLI